jgi:hypothetical protein
MTIWFKLGDHFEHEALKANPFPHMANTEAHLPFHTRDRTERWGRRHFTQCCIFVRTNDFVLWQQKGWYTKNQKVKGRIQETSQPGASWVALGRCFEWKWYKERKEERSKGRTKDLPIGKKNRWNVEEKWGRKGGWINEYSSIYNKMVVR